MSQPQPNKSVLRLAAPLIFSFILRDAFGWVDMIFASDLRNAAGENVASIAAIGVTGPLMMLMIACWVGSSNALTSRMAAAMGARQDAKVDQLLHATKRLIWGLIGTFALLASVIWFHAELWGLDAEATEQFRIYGTVVLLGSSFTTFWTILPDSIVKAHHDMRSTMMAGIASSLLNVVLNAIFVYVFGWGIFGIAFATVLGRLGGLAYAVRVANRHESRRRAEATGEDMSLAPRPIRYLLTLAVPSGLSFVLMGLEGMVINKYLTYLPNGTTNVAAFGLIDRAGRSLSMPMIALGVAMLPLAARCWGAGDTNGIRRELNTGLRVVLIYGVVFVLPVVWFAAPAFAHAMAEKPEFEEATRLGLRWLPLGVILGSPLFLLRTTFEGMQKPLPGLASSVARAVLLSVPMGMAGAYYAETLGITPIEGLVLGMSAGSGIASIGMWIWIRAWFRRCSPAQPAQPIQ